MNMIVMALLALGFLCTVLILAALVSAGRRSPLEIPQDFDAIRHVRHRNMDDAAGRPKHRHLPQQTQQNRENALANSFSSMPTSETSSVSETDPEN